jgi:hypothetical protein
VKCNRHEQVFYMPGELLEHLLNDHIYGLETLMTEQLNDQARLEADVAALKQAFADEVAALKSKVATNPQAPANSLDFSSLEGLLASVKADVSAPAPAPISSDDPSLASSAPAVVAPIAGTAPSPFAEPDETPADEAAEPVQEPQEVPAPAAEPAAQIGDPAAEATPSTEATPSAPAQDAMPSS